MLQNIKNLRPPLEFGQPLLNAAGSLGFAPDPRGPVPMGMLGAFFTNPISHRPRKASLGKRVGQVAGEAWLHSGWPNPGLSACIRRYREAWARAEIPIIVHLLANEAGELGRDVERVEELDNVMAIELSFDVDADPAIVERMCRKASGERPLIAQIARGQAVEFGKCALAGGAAALSMEAPRTVLDENQNQSGRLYGTSVLEKTLEVVGILVELGAEVIGGGGVYSLEQARALLEAGAMAVQLDSVLWKANTDLEDWKI